jgi:hypothetical protein
MNRAALTALYLDEVKRRGLGAKELAGRPPGSEAHRTFFRDRYLSRPLFLGHDEVVQLHADLTNVRSAIVSLPGRLFGGDLGAFARAAGMTEVQVEAILRSRSTTVTRRSRADMYLDADGFRLLELNMGSALGGVDHADFCRSLLEHPVLAQFAEDHRLEYVDAVREQVNDILVESGAAPGSRPTVVAAEWPGPNWDRLKPVMTRRTARLRELGVDIYPCHLGQLEIREDRVWLGDRQVDVINRLFLIEDLLRDPDPWSVIGPVLDAAERGWVTMLTPLDSGLYSSKGALAMLSDPENRSLFDPAELASLDRLLPWTRMVRPGPVTLEDGRRVDLLSYAVAHRQDLALKPTALHAGIGLVAGWSEDVTAQAWEEQVRAAMDGPYVLQRRIRSIPELFPADDGDPIPWMVTWGVFCVLSGFGGVYARATTIESNAAVTNFASGAYVGSSLHARPDPG